MADKKKKEVEELSPVLKKLEELFGPGTIMEADKELLVEVKEWISTGSLTLNKAISGDVTKGIPKGLCTCIIGKEGASKTTLALHLIANEQKKGNLAAFVDIEGTLDLEYAKSIGVDLSKLHIINDEKYLKHLKVKDREMVSGEEWMELVAKLVSSGLYGIVVMDSAPALIPLGEITNGLVGGKLAGVASMAAKGYRLMNGALKRSNTALVYLNQWRMNPGGYVPMTEPFGEAWKYFQALKIEISKSVDKDDDGTYGIVVKGKISKSKVGIPYRKFEYYVEFGKGIIQDYEVITAAVDKDVIKKTGNTYSFEGTKLGIGEKQLNQFFTDNPEVLETVKQKVFNEQDEDVLPTTLGDNTEEESGEPEVVGEGGEDNLLSPPLAEEEVASTSLLH